MVRTATRALLISTVAVGVLISPLATAQCESEVLRASDGGVLDSFGDSVCISGRSMVVGAPALEKAYVFEEIGGAWTETAQLSVVSTALSSSFGTSVACNSSCILVGDLEGISDPGSAYVFERSGSTWVEAAKLVASDGEAGDFFGFSVALEGTRALIGAFGEDDAGASSGAAYVFDGSGGSWSEVAKLTPDDAAAGRFFGVSVDLSRGRALIGATSPIPGPQGAAYVFDDRAGVWDQAAKLLPSDSTAGFGSAVSSIPGLLLIGAPGDGHAGANAGAAYLFDEGASGWTETQKLVASNAAAGDFFGRTVALGKEVSAIGAPGRMLGFDDSVGAAYLFAEGATSWTERACLMAQDPQEEGLYGAAVALDGDTLAVGEPGCCLGSLVVGEAHVWSVSGAGCVALAGAPAALSLVQGGSHELELNAGVGFAADLYLVLGSATGTSPGVPVGPLLLPLNADGYFGALLLNPGGIVTDSLGTLDGIGKAAASLALPAGLDPGLLGVTLNHAFLVLDSQSLAPGLASNPAPVSFVP